MDLKAKHLSEHVSDPIEFLHQLRQTTEPIGGGTEYSEDGELVEYEVAIEAVKKANDAFIEKACEWLEPVLKNYAGYYVGKDILGDFKRYMKGE